MCFSLVRLHALVSAQSSCSSKPSSVTEWLNARMNESSGVPLAPEVTLLRIPQRQVCYR